MGVKRGLDVLCQQNNLQFWSQNDGYFNSSNRMIHCLYNRMYCANKIISNFGRKTTVTLTL